MTHTSLSITHEPIDRLTPNPRNPRTHSKKQVRQIATSIRQFGFVVPVLVDQQCQIIAGHGRLLAAKEIGMEQVPVIQVDHLSEAQARAYMIADNRLTENSRWNEELLAEHFTELSALDLDFDLEVTGFEVAEIDLMIEGAVTETDSPPEAPVPSGPQVTQPGDLWLLGKHRLICGNSLQSDRYQQLMQQEQAQMVFTDPPYNVPVNGHVSGLGKNQHREFAMASGEMSAEQFTEFLRTICSRLTEVGMDGSLHYICMDWRHLQELLTAGNAVYRDLKNICIWVKDNGGMGSLYRSRHECVVVFKHGAASHRNNVELGQHGRYRTNVWEYSGANSFARQNNEEEGDLQALHPTVKPVALVADAILDCTKRGDIVLDVFLGSGSTLIAAEKVGRRCYAIELDPIYVDTAIRRWQQWTGEQAIHHESGKTFQEMERNHER